MCYNKVTKGKEKEIKKMEMCIITYRSFKTYWDKEVYTERETAKRRFKSLIECKNVDNVKMEIRED